MRKRGEFMCGRCGKKFDSETAVRNHAKDTHVRKGGATDVFRRFDTVGEPEEESFADRAIQAQLDIAMGLPTDDDWLLP